MTDADIEIQKKTIFAAADRALLYAERYEAYLSLILEDGASLEDLFGETDEDEEEENSEE